MLSRLGPRPKGGRATSVRYANGVRGRLMSGRGADPANGVLLWIHGGNFVSGTPRLEQLLAAGYAAQCGIPSLLSRYRRPPEHAFPAAADDLLAAYRQLLDEGFPADRIPIGGLSAGGAPAVGLLGDIRRADLPMPTAALLLSPVLQLSVEPARRSERCCCPLAPIRAGAPLPC